MSAVLMRKYNGDGTVTATTRECPMCGKSGTVTVPEAEIEAWKDGHGPLIQHAMPSLSAADREMLLSGTHDECWQKMFAGEEGDNE